MGLVPRCYVWVSAFQTMLLIWVGAPALMLAFLRAGLFMSAPETLYWIGRFNENVAQNLVLETAIMGFYGLMVVILAVLASVGSGALSYISLASMGVSVISLLFTPEQFADIKTAAFFLLLVGIAGIVCASISDWSGPDKPMTITESELTFYGRVMHLLALITVFTCAFSIGTAYIISKMYHSFALFGADLKTMKDIIVFMPLMAFVLPFILTLHRLGYVVGVILYAMPAIASVWLAITTPIKSPEELLPVLVFCAMVSLALLLLPLYKKVHRTTPNTS